MMMEEMDAEDFVNFDGDDEIADLFSFGVESCEIYTDRENAEYNELMKNTTPASITDDDVSNYSDDSFLQLMEQNKDTAVFDALVVAEESEEKEGDKTDEDLEIVDMQEILDWLDDDEELQRLRQDDLVIIEPPKEETLEKVLAQVTASPSMPGFETLEQAVKSPKSTIPQIRDLLIKEGFQVSASVRPHLWCKVICGKTLDETLKSSVADSFQQWEKNWHKEQEEKAKKEENEKERQDEQNSETEKKEQDEKLVEESLQEQPSRNKKEQPRQDWIEFVSDSLADRVAITLHGDKEVSRKALIAILHNHYQDVRDRTSGIKDKKDDAKEDDDKMDDGADGGENDQKETGIVEIKDRLLPPVACALLSTGIPKVAASVILSKIVPNFMPILGLTYKERLKAGDVLHSQFYLLACYHLPCLAIHMDRYIPNWYKGSPVGLIPQSWLVSHLAGECNGTFMNLQWLQCLWDLVLTSSNNSLRFFLAMALMQTHAQKLVLLTGDALSEEVKRVLSFNENTPSDGFAIKSEGQATNKEAIQWVHEWSDNAQALWKSTPLCIIQNLKQLEDDAVNDALLERQRETERRLKVRLEAEAKAQQEVAESEREKKAEEARLRLTRARLVAYYRQFNPEKECNVDKLMELYKGRYEILDAKLKTKYGVGFNPPLRPAKKSEGTGGGRGGFGALRNKRDKKCDEENATELGDHVLKVKANEAVPGVCWSKSALRSKILTIKEGSKLVNTRDGLLPLKFHVVDSRPKDAVEAQGRFPISINLSPETFLDPDCLMKQTEILESLRGMTHLCIMGEGYSALHELYGHRLNKRLSACIDEDDSRNRNCALFLLKRGFPFVSIVDGGFATMHSFLCREGASIDLEPELVLADYNPEVSVFGQFEKIHSSSGREKAHRKLQNLFDTSMAAITLSGMRLEKGMAPEAAKDPQPSNGGQNVITRFFGRDEPSNDEKGGSGKKPESSIFTRRDSGNAGDSSISFDFRNPFAKKEFEKQTSSSDSIEEYAVKKDDESLLSRITMFGNNNEKKKPAEKGGSKSDYFTDFKIKMERMKDEVLNDTKPEKTNSKATGHKPTDASPVRQSSPKKK